MENNQNKPDWHNYATKTGATLTKDGSTNNQRKKSNGNGGIIALAIFSLLVGAAGLTFGIISIFNANKPTETVATVSADGYYSGNSTEFKETSIANIVSKVTPAVVSIISETRSTGYQSLFGSRTSQSAGTGMIVSADGYIITNKHVIEGATKVQVITDAGDTYDNVSIVGEDPLNDVAYLKIKNAKDLPTITLGDSKSIAVGQPVLAIGNALGAYQNTVTQGIISGTGRSVTASDSNGGNAETLTDMLQTDAAINPGNSGGPLVNAAGDVIGINTAVSTSANGLGFAIPISATKGMLANIMENGKSERAYLGLTYVTVTAEVAKEAKLSVNHGAYIYNSSNRNADAVVEGGPADKAGIKKGDVITKVGNIEVGRAGSISTLIGEYKVGDTVQLTYIRDGKEATTNVTLEAYED
ncbi:MAG: trypsin-like peptidase domain-containing protein [Candidatus Saccharibacteria bacterium]|nr:trypsin-like peptidase domain-containing protein [Candidatus Saccharibacteria bacterium]